MCEHPTLPRAPENIALSLEGLRLPSRKDINVLPMAG
jgi:hypothetical protein